MPLEMRLILYVFDLEKSYCLRWVSLQFMRMRVSLMRLCLILQSKGVSVAKEGV